MPPSRHDTPARRATVWARVYFLTLPTTPRIGPGWPTRGTPRATSAAGCRCAPDVGGQLFRVPDAAFASATSSRTSTIGMCLEGRQSGPLAAPRNPEVRVDRGTPEAVLACTVGPARHPKSDLGTKGTQAIYVSGYFYPTRPTLLAREARLNSTTKSRAAVGYDRR